MNSSRLYDTKASNVVTQFLYENLYSHIFEQCVVVCNKEAQLQGIDIAVYNKGYSFSIDEKAQINYINNVRNTFSFEIMYLSNKRDSKGVREKRVGWLIKNEVTPTYYALIWIHQSNQSDKCKLKVDDLVAVECMFVNNMKLKEYLYNRGLTCDKMFELSDMIYRNSVRYFYYDNWLKFVYSGRIYEKPINLVIPKNILYDICFKDYLVYKDHYVRI